MIREINSGATMAQPPRMPEGAMQACEPCSKQKKRCDKVLPKCGSCAKYEVPPGLSQDTVGCGDVLGNSEVSASLINIQETT
jgi:hypothetical protein